LEHLATLEANGSADGKTRVDITVVDCGVCWTDYKDENIFILLYSLNKFKILFLFFLNLKIKIHSYKQNKYI